MNINSLTSTIANSLKSLRKYYAFIFVLCCLILFCYQVIVINRLNNPVVSQELLLERSKSASVPNIDKDTVEKIQQLESQNIQVQSLFNELRNNPFNE